MTVCTGCPSITAWVVQSSFFSTAVMNSSVTRTELLLFWKKTDSYAAPPLKFPS